MSEIPRDDFKPLVPVYGAYPMPKVIAEVNIDTPTRAFDDIFRGAENIVEDALAAATEEYQPGVGPRMENRIPFVSPHGTIVTRSSFDRKIKGSPEVSREISDRIEIDFMDDSKRFNHMRITAQTAEFRGGKGYERDSDLISWWIYLYEPGNTQPSVEIDRQERMVDSSIRLLTEESTAEKAYIFSDVDNDHYRSSYAFGTEQPELANAIAEALNDAEIALLQPMVPAMGNRDIVMLRTAAGKDPYRRHIGFIARMSDRLMELRDR